MGDVLLAPFSNNPLRDWPAEHFAALIALLLPRLDPDQAIRIVGTRGQRLSACEIVRTFDPARVVNGCGRASWPEVVEQVRGAACLVGNNSGLAHLSASLGVPTVCLFGGSHQRLEWRPMGPSVVILSRVIACAPCLLHDAAQCPYDKACLRQIEPATVADTVAALLPHHRRRAVA